MSNPQIFLCHSSSDKAFVRQIANELELKDLSVWFDEWEIRVGDSIHDKINEGIKKAAVLIIVLSQKSVESAWVKKELNVALMRELSDKRVFVLPVLLEKCEVPPLLQDKRYADFSNSYSKGLSELLDAILPDRAKSKNMLKKHLLPAVAAGMAVTESDIRAIHEAIHHLQIYLRLPPTTFPQAKAGDPLTARHLNQISNAILDIRTYANLATHWENFPVKSGDFLTVSIFNELLGKTNQTIRNVIRDDFELNLRTQP